MKLNARFFYRLIALCIGLVIHATGSAVLREANLGG